MDLEGDRGTNQEVLGLKRSPLLGMEQGGDDERSVINPLLIPHILEKVLSYLERRDLVNCRKVCRNWKSETRILLQRICLVRFTCVDQVKAYIECLSEVPANEFVHARYQFASSFTQCNITGPSSGPRRYRMTGMIDSVGTHSRDPGCDSSCRDVLVKFFNLFGNRIKKLELDTEFQIPLPELRAYLCKQTENLEELSMTLRYTRSRRFFVDGEPFYKPKLTTLSLRSDVEMVPLPLLQDLFIMAPNLRKLTCLPLFSNRKYLAKRPNVGRIDFIRVLFHTVAMAPNSPPLLYLTNLDINLQLTDSELQGLISKAFPLKYISLGICSDVKGSTLSTLLTAGRTLLIKVALNFHQSAPAASYRYKIDLMKIRYLSLCGFRSSISFVKKCPELKTLVIARCGNLTTIFPLHEIGPHDLQELFLQWDPLEDPDVVHRITRCFPRIKKFSMKRGNDAVLREIYLTMPYLQCLTILEGGFTDEGITGISEVVYKDIAESGSLFLVDAGKLRTNMSIITLSNLRKLRLESDLITDVSICLGIGSCMSLQHLHLECALLTDYCLLQIEKFHHLETLNLVACVGLSLEKKTDLLHYFQNQKPHFKMEFTTIEEVMRESQRRALILPDMPYDYYTRQLGAIDLDEEEIEEFGAPPANGQPGPFAHELESSDDEDYMEEYHLPMEGGAILRARRYDPDEGRWDGRARGGDQAGVQNRGGVERGRRGVRYHFRPGVNQHVMGLNRNPNPPHVDGNIRPEALGINPGALHPAPGAGGGVGFLPEWPNAAPPAGGAGFRLQAPNAALLRQYRARAADYDVGFGPANPNDYPQPIPLDLDFIQDVEM